MAIIVITFVILFALASLAITIFSVVELATKKFKREQDRVIWLAVCLLLGAVGPVIYLTQRKKLLAVPPGNEPYDDREYLPPLEDDLARPQVQSRFDDEDYV